jgi:hypothetical protein
VPQAPNNPSLGLPRIEQQQDQDHGERHRNAYAGSYGHPLIFALSPATLLGSPLPFAQ